MNKLTQEIIEKSYFSAVNDSIIISITDESGIIQFANQKFCNMSKYTSLELIGKPHSIVKSDYHPKEFFVNLWKEISKGNTWQGEMCNRNKFGQIYWVNTTIYPIKDNENIIGHIAIRFDITYLKQIENELKNSSNQVKKLTDLKSEFLANMSHEIRTPLNGIIGFSSLLRTDNINSDQKQIITNIKSSSEHLLSLINDILDFSKIESGSLDISKSNTKLITIINEIAPLMLQLADEKNIRFEISFDCDISLFFSTDIIRVKQILINLIGNAIKFTDKGYVSLNISAKDQNLIFAVKDTGAGIKEEDLSKLFQKFGQLNSSLSKKAKGTGLGLVISQELARLLGGKILVESTLNEGSVFTLILPLESEQNPETNATTPNSLPYQDFESTKSDNLSTYIKILIAEDNIINQSLMTEILHRHNIKPTIANNGKEAYELCINNFYDLIIMDIQMPEMDGIEATQAILNDSSIIFKPVIIGFTANVVAADREKGLKAGIKEFYPKPLLPKKFIELLNKQQNAISLIHLDKVRLFTEYAEIKSTLISNINQILLAKNDPLDEIQNAALANDSNKIRQAAHKLLGTARLIFADRLAYLTSELETFCIQSDQAQIDRLISLISEEYSIVYKILSIAKEEYEKE